MIVRTDIGKLLNDLDCNNFRILNPGDVLPAGNLVASTDPRLTDERTPLDGSVLDKHVIGPPIGEQPDQRIVQSKLNLDGNLPANFIGTGKTKGAQGDLYQPVSQKAQANGYASLDGSGRIPAGQINLAGTGKVTSVKMDVPDEFDVVPASISGGSEVFDVKWSASPPYSWFGRTGVPGVTQDPPAFQTVQIPPQLVPSLPASKIISGTFARNALPVAIGVGVDHAIGAVPDPEKEGDPNDYLGRDMKWHQMNFSASYQPTILDVSITILYYEDNRAYISLSTPTKNAIMFYQIETPGEALTPEYTQFTGTFSAVTGATVRAYGVAVGYNNSPVASLLIPTPT